MTRRIRNLVIGFFMVGAMGTAHALPITDVYTPENGSVTLTTGNPYSYQHDLLQWGFDPLTDILESALLSFAIEGAGGQPLTVEIDGFSFGGSLSTFLNDGLSVNINFLQGDGLLDVTLTKGGGQGSVFAFYGSTLVVNGASGGDTPAAVPVPGTLALFALGVFAMGATAVRRSRAH